MTKVSIITPVYNAETTLHKTIDSIISQTLKDWELLLIDDGSTDTSPKICDEYVAKDKRITAIHKLNEGVAMARKAGIDIAKGEYSIHVDADDWVEPTMLEELYNKAKAEHADIVIADYYVNNNKDQSLSKQQPSSLQPDEIQMDFFNNKLLGVLWNKLIRTNLYKKHNAKFFSGINHCEDLLIMIQILQNNGLKIVYLPKALYHYCMNESSITHNFTRKTYETRIKFRNKLAELLRLPDKTQIIEKVSFGIFTEALIYKILTKNEIKEGIKKYKNQIEQIQSLRWKLGFFLISIGFYKIAHKLMHY